MCMLPFDWNFAYGCLGSCRADSGNGATEEPVFAVACGIVLLLLAFRTSAEIRYWRDGETLFGRALEVTSGNYTAHYQLGNELMRKGRLDSAVSHFSEAVRFRPDHFLAHHNLGIALARLGRSDEALAHYLAGLQHTASKCRNPLECRRSVSDARKS